MSKWYQPSKPGQIKPIPWLAPKAIQYLENIIQPDFEIIEHGSGGSTLWFATRCASVMSFEDDPDWQMVVKAQAPENVTIKTHFELSPEPQDEVDLLLIDGEPVKDRAGWIAAAPNLVKSGGWVVLDNANRPEYEKEREGLKKFATLVYTVNSNESTSHLYLITEFWRVK